MIALVAQLCGVHLQRYVAVAHVVGRAGQFQGVVTDHARELLRRSRNHQYAAIQALQAIALRQHAATGQKQTDFLTRDRFGAQAAAGTQLVGQFQYVVMGAALFQPGMTFQHRALLKTGNNAAPAAARRLARRATQRRRP